MKNIFVGNLDFSATESSLRALFEPYGRVDRVNLVTDRRHRAFARFRVCRDDGLGRGGSGNCGSE